jgi:large subunit ribosomal protein L29
MKASDLREKSIEDLVELQKSLARDVFQNRLKNFTNRLDDTSSIRKTRRDVARVLTLLRQRKLEEERAIATEEGTPTAAASPPAERVEAGAPRPTKVGGKAPSKAAKAKESPASEKASEGSNVPGSAASKSRPSGGAAVGKSVEAGKPAAKKSEAKQR